MNERFQDGNQTVAYGFQGKIKITVRGLDFFYGKFQALHDNNLDVAENRITAVIGPSGCGKSTHIRTYNRMHQLYREQSATGSVKLGAEEILSSDMDVTTLRRRIGMIFQKPSPFPMSIYDNIAYGLRLN